MGMLKRRFAVHRSHPYPARAAPDKVTETVCAIMSPARKMSSLQCRAARPRLRLSVFDPFANGMVNGRAMQPASPQQPSADPSTRPPSSSGPGPSGSSRPLTLLSFPRPTRTVTRRLDRKSSGSPMAENSKSHPASPVDGDDHDNTVTMARSTQGVADMSLDGNANSNSNSPFADEASDPGHSPDTAPAAVPGLHPQDTANVWVGSFEEGSRAFRTLLLNMRDRADPTKTSVSQVEFDRRLAAVKLFLRYLEFGLDITPSLRLRSNHSLDKALALIHDPRFESHVPAYLHLTVEAVRQRLEDENWGENTTGPNSPAETSQALVPLSHNNSTTAVPNHSSNVVLLLGSEGLATIRLPPASHPIWGVDGIMHGLVMITAAANHRISYAIDPRYEYLKRSAKIHGHNGHTPGDWWPLQRAAHLHGAHGAPMRGITGNGTDGSSGAYSIVISGSGRYKDLDLDQGDRLFYSADSSHDNEDPRAVAHCSNATLSLKQSMRLGTPVRVLRSRGGGGKRDGEGKAYVPVCGIRYDGLYQVLDVRRLKNARGGLYERFEMVRMGGQESLESIVMRSPTRKQREDWSRYKDGY